MIARRGWASRLAAMGISDGLRGRGADTWFMEKLIREACERQEREMMLEVIEGNKPAIRLYQNYGFQTIRKLIGLIHKDAAQPETGDLQEMDLREMGHLISQHGLPDRPGNYPVKPSHR